MAPIVEFQVGQTVYLKKTHPCGSYEWEVFRLGADIGIQCKGCGRRVLMPRRELEGRLKPSRQGRTPEVQKEVKG